MIFKVHSINTNTKITRKCTQSFYLFYFVILLSAFDTFIIGRLFLFQAFEGNIKELVGNVMLFNLVNRRYCMIRWLSDTAMSINGS